MLPLFTGRNDGIEANPLSSPFSSTHHDNTPARHETVDSNDGYIYQVQFKRSYRWLLLSPESSRDIKRLDFIKVEADRGEDLGIVCSRTQSEHFKEEKHTAGFRGRGSANGGQKENKYILRPATFEECQTLAIKNWDEERALQVCRDKITQHKLPMTIVDCEYQFDRHKLTFYFQADRRIDFRELVTELFTLYKTRIWMQQVDDSFKGDNVISSALAAGQFGTTANTW
jgi:cell fate regulator YaaT (PSP1 superfamily)